MVPQLKLLEGEFFTDSYAAELNETIAQLSLRFANITNEVRNIVALWSTEVDEKNKKRFYSAIKQSIGVDLSGITNQNGLADVLAAKTSENVGLIKSLPEEYYKKINVAINNMTVTGKSADSIVDTLLDIGIKTENRARLIARDQTQKLNAAITQKRQENLGITQYTWSSSQDERTRPEHIKNHGKVFSWRSPPAKTGHPGEDINCRCVALPIINLEEL